MASPSPSSSATSWESLASRVFAPPLPAATLGGKSGDPEGVSEVSNVRTPAQGAERKTSFVTAATSGDEVALFYMALEEGHDVCGGCIGVDNSKFCTMPCSPGQSTCGRYAKHNRKAGVTSPAYFISASWPGMAFLKPCLREPLDGGFAPSVYDTLSGTRTQEDWIAIFTALQDVASLTESAQQDIVARLSRVVGVAPTPMALRKRSAIEDLAQLVAKNPGGEHFNMAADEEWDGSLLIEEDASLTDLTEKWNGLVKVTHRQRRDISDLESTARDLLEEVDDKVVRVTAVMGSRKNIDAPELTVWASIGAHSELFIAHKSEIKNLKDRMEINVEDLQGKYDKVHDVLNSQVFPVVSHLTTRVEQIQVGGSSYGLPSEARELQRLRDAQVRMDGELQTMAQRIGTQGPPDQTETFRTELRDVQHMQEKMVDAIQALRSSARNDNSNQASNTEIEQLKEAVGRMQDEMSELRLENRRLHAALNSNSFSFGGHFFHTEETYDVFVTTYLQSGYYGYCLDFISLMECYEDANRSSSDGLKNTYTVAKAGYEDVQEARIDHSFGCTFPALFGAPQETANPAKKMALLTNKDVWHDHASNSGLKKDIDIFMSGFAASIDSEIHGELGQGSTASLFFVAMFQHTYTFWQRYSAWITKMVQEKMSHVGAQDNEAHLASVWSLICWMTYSMFIEMAKRRKAGTGNKKVGQSIDKKKKCIKILKGTLGAHKFMKELMDAEFERHPIFAATMDEFLLKNKASQISHDALCARFKKCEEAAKSAQAAADKAIQMTKKGAAAHPK